MVQKFDFQELDLKGAYLIKPFYATDNRGGLIKDYNVDTFKANGIDYDLNRKIYETLPSITLKDLVDFEKNNIVGKPRLRLILGNKDELNISALEKLGPVRYLTTEEIFGY